MSEKCVFGQIIAAAAAEYDGATLELAPDVDRVVDGDTGFICPVRGCALTGEVFGEYFSQALNHITGQQLEPPTLDAIDNLIRCIPSSCSAYDMMLNDQG